MLYVTIGHFSTINVKHELDFYRLWLAALPVAHTLEHSAVHRAWRMCEILQCMCE